MAPRRSHHKSRRGCITCKKRRVKCGEEGPPCQNCKARDTVCEYANPVPELHNTANTSGKEAVIVTSPDSIMTAAERRKVEFQLLHRWSTTTYLSCSSRISDDYEIWQKTVPEVACENDFLLDTIFAVTAFEMAYSFPHESSRWASLALEYQGLAFHRFRNALQSGESPTDHDAMLYCSILLFVLALATATAATPYDTDSVIDHIIAVHELVQGTVVVMYQKPNCLETHALWSKTPKLADLVKADLNSQTAIILHRLEEMNGRRRGDGEEVSSEYKGCQNAITTLRWLFQICGHDRDLQSFVLAFLSLAGTEYVSAVKTGDHVSLLALVCWGVMFESFEPIYWFVDGFGARVVYEVADMLQGEEIAESAQDVLQWAMTEHANGRIRRDSPHDSALEGCESSLAGVSLV